MSRSLRRVLWRVALVAIALTSVAATYEVQEGDTLSEIAVREGTTVPELMALNGLSDPNVIFAGQALQTGDSAAPDPTVSLRSHVVQPGETLVGIARDHGVSEQLIEQANGIVDGRVFAGFRIRLSALPVAYPVPEASMSHVVVAGETLASIARRFGVDQGSLVRLNSLGDPDLIGAGSRLVIREGWACPVPDGRFSNDWGYVKPDGRTHEGIDIHAPRGTEVVAPVAGHLHRNTGERGGRQFSLYGADGVTYFGAHLESFGAGGDVAAGDVIGTVGSSGNAAGTSPHLHFEVLPAKGVSVNPYPALVAACG